MFFHSDWGQLALNLVKDPIVDIVFCETALVMPQSVDAWCTSHSCPIQVVANSLHGTEQAFC